LERLRGNFIITGLVKVMRVRQQSIKYDPLEESFTPAFDAIAGVTYTTQVGRKITGFDPFVWVEIEIAASAIPSDGSAVQLKLPELPDDLEFVLGQWMPNKCSGLNGSLNLHETYLQNNTVSDEIQVVDQSGAGISYNSFFAAAGAAGGIGLTLMYRRA